MYAIFVVGGKQYRAEKGDEIVCEKLDAEVGAKVTFDQVLLVGDKVGTPFVAGAKVTGEVVKQGLGKKIVVFKYKAKKNERKKQGHRQAFTVVRIANISVKKEAKAEEAAE